jgi:DNA polymerase-1
MTVLLVDGNNLIHRLFWVLDSQGVASKENLISSVTRSINALKRDLGGDRVVVAWDKKLLWPSTNFRKTEMEGDYKSQRPDTDNVYQWEGAVMENIRDHTDWKQMFPRCLEADDVIAFYVEQGLKENERAIIVSNDKDLLQLISPVVEVYSPRKKKLYNEDVFFQEYEFEPILLWKYKALVGDPSDNIKGVKGIGPKTAKKILANGMQSLTEAQLETVLFNKKMIKLPGAYRWQEGEEEALREQLESDVFPVT